MSDALQAVAGVVHQIGVDIPYIASLAQQGEVTPDACAAIRTGAGDELRLVPEVADCGFRDLVM